MSQFNDVYEAALRSHFARTATYSKPTTLTIRLYTANPGEADGGTEVSGGSYAAQGLNPLDANWTAASSTDGLTDNASAITFPAPTANWGVVTGTSVRDNNGYGFYGALAQSKTVNNGDAAPSFPIGALDLTWA